MKKRSLILLVLVLVLISIAMLYACNTDSQSAPSQDFGTYYLFDGTKLNPDSFIELKSGNVWYDGESEGKFTLKDGKITLFDGDDELMSGTVSDGVLTLNFMGMETVYKKSSTSIGSDKVDSSAMIKSIDGGQVDGLNVSLEIGDTVEDVDLSGMITTSKDCSWQLFLSRSATAADAIATKIIVPKKGVNTYYIVVTSADNKTNRTYTLNVWKNYYATLSFYANDRLYTTEEVLTHTTYGEGPSCSVAGYNFNGWGCEGYYVVEDKIFNAKLTAKNYKVVYDVNGGDDSLEDGIATFDEDFSLPTPRKTGYIFMGWTYDGNTYENVLHYSFTTDIKLTAKWAIRSYKVVVRSDDETRGAVNVSAQQKEYNSTINLSATTKTGYIFAGWYETHDYGGGYKKISDQLNCTATIPAYDVRYVAKWSKNTAERNNPSAGRISSLTSTYKVGDELTFTSSTNSGCVWVGWFDGDTKLTDNEKLVVKATAQDKTYTAKWSRIKIDNEYFRGDVTQLTSAYKVGDDVICTATTRTEYVWVGWFDGDTKVTDNETLVVKATAQDKTYTTKRSIIRAIGTDDSAGKVSTTYLSYKVGDEFTSTATTNLGYTWLGWFDGDTKVSDSEKLVVRTTAQNKTYKAKWAVNEDMSDFFFESGNDWCKITGLKNQDATEIVIPNYVTNIGDNAFNGCTGLTSVTISNGVTSIGYRAFEGCIGLTSITIPDSVTSIGGMVFRNCTGLTSVTIPNSVASIGNSAFYDCTGLTSVTIPNSVTSIGSGAFYNCTGLTFVTIGNGVTSIGGYAFYGCTGLTSITIPDSVTSIGSSAFYGCTGLASITIPDSVASIGDSAFDGCTNISNVNYTGSIASWCAISGLGNIPRNTGFTLTIAGQEITGELVIPDGVTSISDSAFSGCKGLTSITIPDSVTSIGNNAFKDCPIENATMPTNAISSIPKAKLTTVVINGGENIPTSAFKGCTGLTSVTIGNSVTSIGWGAFQGCKGLTSITIPNSVTIIDWDAFNGCTGITSVTIPDSVTSIGVRAFKGCTGLTSITIPASVTKIRSDAFKNCNSLLTIYCEVTRKPIEWDSENDDGWNPDNRTVVWGYNNITTGSEYDYVVHSDKVYLTKYKGSSTIINIPNQIDGKDVVGFGEIFRGNINIKEVTIPNSVTSIDNCAFRYCARLTSITIPDSVTSIGLWAFEDTAYYNNNSNWEYDVLYIGKHLIKAKDTVWGYYEVKSGTICIARSAFLNCKGLTSIIIPDSVTSIGGDAFSNCTNISKVNYTGNIAGWCALTELVSITMQIETKLIIEGKEITGELVIPEGVTSIGKSAFCGCSKLTSITIPDSVTIIGEEAFAYCTGLTSITIPNSVTSIEAWAFSGCKGLTSIIIPDSVTSIGESAFYGCKGLTSITIPNSVTSIKYKAFQNCTGLTSITIPESVSNIGYNTFSGCEKLKTIKFKGTKSQWYSIEKGTNWKLNVPSTCKVVCTDGTVSI